MNKTLVGTLLIEDIPIKMWRQNPDGQWWVIQPTHHFVVEDIFIGIPQDGSPFLPDFGIQGHFMETEKNFYIDPEGPHIIYVTGVPKFHHDPTGIKSKYRMAEVLWLGYWEDTIQGYLFQITQKD